MAITLEALAAQLSTALTGLASVAETAKQTTESCKELRLATERMLKSQDARQASRAPACTPVAAPLPAPISVASVDATPAAVCVRASPAPAPSALTAADEKPVVESLAELSAKPERILAKLAPMDNHNAATSLSPSTTTTSPPTAPQHAPPWTTTAAAATTTAPPPTAPVPVPARPEEAPVSIELGMGSTLQLSVVPEPVMLAPARCSMECRQVSSKQCEAVNTALASGVPVLAAGVLVAAIRVPPHPPDMHVPARELEKTPLASMIPQLIGVMSKLPMTCSVHQKEQERPMPWPSFI